MMSVLINWCWCSDSNWGGNWNGRVIVSIERIPNGKSYHDTPTADWTALIDEIKLKWEKFGDPHSTYRLKPEVMEWLAKEIPDRRPYSTEDDPNPKGWAVGTDQYNAVNVTAFNVFFDSYRQAARFIKRWSSIGKPNEYLNYFKDKRRKYNPVTKTLQPAPR